MPIESSDMTGAIIRLLDRLVLVVSVYVPPTEPETLQESYRILYQLIYSLRQARGELVDILLLGDFNQHDYL